jgi:hypothetical protein
VLGLIGIAAVFVQGPLRRVVEIPIVVDRVTGETTIQQRLSVETIPPMEALDKHNLATFVRAREGYSWMFLQRDFDQVARMAVPAVFADYNRQFEGDGALQKKIGAAEDWRINIVGVRLRRLRAQRQQERRHGHVRQGGAPDRPQPARGHHAACGQRRLPVPAQGAGQRARPAGEPVRLRGHGLPVRPRDQHGCTSGSQAMKPLAWLDAAFACAALCGLATAAPEAADPRLREVVYDPRAVVTVPVKRGIVTLVVLLGPDESITEVAVGLGGDCSKADAAWCVAAQPGGRNLFVKAKSVASARTTWPWSPTAARTPALRGPGRRRPTAAGLSAGRQGPPRPAPPARLRCAMTCARRLAGGAAPTPATSGGGGAPAGQAAR